MTDWLIGWLMAQVCRCDSRRIHTQCKASALKMGVSIHALIAILVCILTILGELIRLERRSRSVFWSPQEAVWDQAQSLQLSADPLWCDCLTALGTEHFILSLYIYK